MADRIPMKPPGFGFETLALLALWSAQVVLLMIAAGALVLVLVAAVFP